MLIAIEGVSATGETTLASRYRPAVVDELVTISGKPGADAHHYQERQVRQRIEDSQK